MDFYSRGTVEVLIYQILINTRQVLMQKICDLFATIMENLSIPILRI